MALYDVEAEDDEQTFEWEGPSDGIWDLDVD